jgi:hypothetical protein
LVTYLAKDLALTAILVAITSFFDFLRMVLALTGGLAAADSSSSSELYSGK